MKWYKSYNGTQYDVVIVKDDGIGDYFIFIDALRAYKKIFKNKRVLLVCNKSIKCIAEMDPFFSSVYSVDTDLFDKHGRYFIKTIFEIRKIKANICFYPCWSGHACGEIIVRCIKAKEKIGMYRCKYDYRRWWHYWAELIVDNKYSKLVRFDKGKSEISACEFFTKEVVDHNYSYQGGQFSIDYKDIIIPGKYVLIALSASSDLRVWNPRKFAHLIDNIPPEYKIVLTGYGIKDECRATIVIDKVANKERIFNFVGKTTLKDLLVLIMNSSFTIGNDSSAVHMATATGVPSICIFNGTEYGRFLPYPDDIPSVKIKPLVVCYKMDCYGCGKYCDNIKNGVYACIDAISVDMVLNAVNKIIDGFNEKDNKCKG